MKGDKQSRECHAHGTAAHSNAHTLAHSAAEVDSETSVPRAILNAYKSYIDRLFVQYIENEINSTKYFQPEQTQTSSRTRKTNFLPPVMNVFSLASTPTAG